MMTSNAYIFRVTGLLWGKPSAHEQTVEQIIAGDLRRRRAHYGVAIMIQHTYQKAMAWQQKEYSGGITHTVKQ